MFQVEIGGTDLDRGARSAGGLEWKVRLCLLVAVAAETSVAGVGGVRMKQLVRDGVWGLWRSSWRACARIAPLEHLDTCQEDKDSGKGQTWGQFFVSSILGAGEGEFHDGDEEQDDGDSDGTSEGDGEGEPQKDFGGGKEGWREVRVETVECEVGIKVWPGNTAFKAMDVVFDV